MIYLDQNSTSFPKAPGVGEVMCDYLVNRGVNIGRGNYDEAYTVEADVIDTRERLASLFGGDDPRRVIFTPGVTFSLNLFFNGALEEGDHVVISGMEHNAVMRPLSRLARTRAVRYSVAETNRQGEVTAEAFEKAIEKKTKAIVTLHASNVCGTILPIEAIGRLARDRGLLFAVDGAQTAGSVPIDVAAMNIDFLAFTGHKTLGGPHGIGGFLITEALSKELEPLIVGGTGSRSDSMEQPDFLPDKYESGTMNIPGILGLRQALIELERHDQKKIFERKMALTDRFLKGVTGLDDVRVVGLPTIAGRTATVSLDFGERDNALIAYELERGWGIMTRVGLHCAPLAHQSLGSFPHGTVRFSFGAHLTDEEIDTAVEAIKTLLKG